MLRPACRCLAVLVAVTLSLCAQGTPNRLPRNIRGTNYVPATAVVSDNVMAMLPFANTHSHAYGQNIPEAMFGEIERLAQSGLNNIRLIPSFYAFVADQVAFESCLRDLCVACRLNGIKITYIVWSAIGVTAPIVSRDGVNSQELWHELIGTDPYRDQCYEVYTGAALRTLQHHLGAASLTTLPPGETIFGSMHHDPGNELIAMSGDSSTWPYGLRTRINAYLGFLGNFFANDPDGQSVFEGYDLFNEPNGGAAIFNIPLSNYLEFIQDTYDALYAYQPGAQFTIGWAGADNQIDQFDAQARAHGINCTYVSCHSYAGPEQMRVDVFARKAYATSIGQDLVISEFYRTDFNAGTLKHLFRAILDAQAGGQMWGFFQSNVFANISNLGFAAIDGVVIPVLHPLAVNPMTFDPQNPSDLAAVSGFTSGNLNPPPFSSIRILGPDGLPTTAATAGNNFSLQILTPRAGEPMYLVTTIVNSAVSVCVNAGSSTCQLFPGAGFIYLLPQSTVSLLGPAPASGIATPVYNMWLPPSLAGTTFVFQAYVGHGFCSPFVFHNGDLTWLTLVPVL